MTNAAQILESLNADEIRQRLEQLNSEQQALRVLLRAAAHLPRRAKQDRSIADAKATQ